MLRDKCGDIPSHLENDEGKNGWELPPDYLHQWNHKKFSKTKHQSPGVVPFAKYLATHLTQHRPVLPSPGQPYGKPANKIPAAQTSV